MMRGADQATESLFSYVDFEERIPPHYPLRKIRQVVVAALASLDGEFDRLYSAEGRPSIAPERLIRASLIQILFSIQSERQLTEQMRYNLLFCWFVGLGIDDGDTPLDDDEPGDPSATRFDDLSDQPQPESATMTRPTRRDRNAEVDFKGEKRSNATQVSATDPDARLLRSHPARAMKSRSGLIVQADLTRADGHAVPIAGLLQQPASTP